MLSNQKHMANHLKNISALHLAFAYYLYLFYDSTYILINT